MLETPDVHKETVRKLYEEAMNGAKTQMFAELISEDYLDDLGNRGPSGFASNVAGLRAGFPDIHFTLRDMVAEGDRVAVRWTWEATHAGSYRRWAATGRRVRNSGIAVYRFREGRIVGGALETDRLGVLQQIGVVPDSLVPAGPPVNR